MINGKEKKQKIFEISFLDYSSNLIKKEGAIPIGLTSNVSQNTSSNKKIIPDNSNDIEKFKAIKAAGIVNYASDIDKSSKGSFYTLSQGPKIVGRFSPEYPISARKMRKNGQVKVEVFLDENGNLLSFSIIESSGKEFTKSVEEELKRTTFYPALVNGVPVKSRGILPIRFEINDAS